MRIFISLYNKILLILLLSVASFNAIAQTVHVDDEVSHWEADILGGLNNDGWQFDFGVAYFPLQYIGVKANIGFAGEIEQIEDWGKDELETGHSYASRFKFNPSLVMRTPRLINWKSQNAGIYLFAEPGIILSPGASGSKGARYCNWDFKGGINLQLDRFILFVGYGISDYSLYSGFPTAMNGLPQNDNYITHSGFIGTAYKF